MKDELLDLYREAGRIARRVLSAGEGMVRPGAGVLETVEAVEAMVLSAGAGLAFPLNCSFNEAAAHDTASEGDERVFSTGDLVKLDLGVHLDGYVADTAVTIDLGDHGELVQASRAALDAAIALARPGITTGELGGAIQAAIEFHGYRPVANLTGHGLDRYLLHGPPGVPNIGHPGGMPLQEGQVVAIEPFASTGSGLVSEAARVEIFGQIAVRPTRLPSARRLLDLVRERHGMPFSRRWLDLPKRDVALANLVKQGIVRTYPVLHDVPGSFVSQAEHTLVILEDGCLVTTA
ncbi:MAG TPA: type II methionyl aminopeptidase [Methanoregulaceae archaeon]|nr:type II methionyl aminopeptidase [Methanoregulaceae archaeon]HQJ88071.1 type II methionyl aminopeptidase [Methanoregulaceae archaeon]